MYKNELKQLADQFPCNADINFPFGYELYEQLRNMNKDLADIDELLTDANLDGIEHKDYSYDIDYSNEFLIGLVDYPTYIKDYILSLIDTPFKTNITDNALDRICDIDVSKYSTDNTLGIKRRDCYNPSLDTYTMDLECLTLADFLGINERYEVPDEFKALTNQFSTYYENVKDQLGDATLDEFLYALINKDTPEMELKKFVSAVLDITIIKPLIEAFYGKDLITQQELSDMERGIQFAAAVVGIISLGTSGILEVPLDQAAKQVGKAFLIDVAATSASYATGIVCEELDLPVGVTIILCIAAGTATSVTLNGIEFRKVGVAGDNGIVVEEVMPPGAKNPVAVYTDGYAQINVNKVDVYMRGKVDIDIDYVSSKIDELTFIKNSNPEAFTKEMDKELSKYGRLMHNYQRSQEMSVTLSNAGITDTVENNNMIVETLFDAAKEVNESNTEIISYIDGPDGRVQMVSRWNILENGNPYLATIILKPVK